MNPKRIGKRYDVRSGTISRGTKNRVSPRAKWRGDTGYEGRGPVGR